PTPGGDGPGGAAPPPADGGTPPPAGGDGGSGGGPTEGGPSGGGSGGGTGSGTSGGSGGGSGGDGGGNGQPAAPPVAAPVPPWVPGSPKDLVVEFAQERLAHLGSANPCRLKPGWSPGVIDAPTRASLACYQQAVVDDGEKNGKNSAEIFKTDDKGTLGPATLTSLWAQGITPEKVRSGSTTWETTQLMAAFWAAYNRHYSEADLTRARINAQYGIDHFRTGQDATSRYSSQVETKIRDYQAAVGLEPSGTVDWPTLRKMIGGSVM
ncbi:peptidoglycan-binding domain-containing protein, partial [Streptomyces cinereoruber]|uniref:peptidoglycan-binding domain-containing protein n=1 Tax=Streptomyces cinereoruber TaxID=67260 RepID=UPI00362E43B2